MTTPQSPTPARSRSRRACAARSAARCSSYVRAPRTLQQRLGLDRPRRAAPRAAQPPGRDGAVEFVGGHDEVGEPGPLGLLGVHEAAGGADLQRAGVADEPHQRVRTGQVGDETEAGLAHGELHVVARTTRRSQASASWKPAPMACPCTAAMVTRSVRRHQVKASWNSAMVASSSSSEPRARSRNDGSPSKPSGVNACRSRPGGEGLALAAQHDDPDIARQHAAPLRANARHRAGDWALRLAGLVECHRGDRAVDGEPYAVLVEHRVDAKSWGPPVGAVTAVEISDCTVTTRSTGDRPGGHRRNRWPSPAVRPRRPSCLASLRRDRAASLRTR